MGGRMAYSVSQQTTSGRHVSAAMRLHMLLHGLAFVAGFTLIFVLIGLFTTALSSIAGQYVSTFTEVLGRLGGLVIIFFGLQFMGLAPRFFASLRRKRYAGILDSASMSIVLWLAASAVLYWGFVQQWQLALPFSALLALFMAYKGAFNRPADFWQHSLEWLESLLYADTRTELSAVARDGYYGSALMGMVFSAGWSPCIGPLLGTILTVAATAGANTGEVAQGMLLLSAYSMGLGIPFIATALLLNTAQGLLRRLQRQMGKIKLFSGSLLILIGILVASGQLQSLSRSFSQGEFADFTYRVEECGLGFFEGSVGLAHVGACLDGSLVPLALNQSASGQFRAEGTSQAYLFPAAAGSVVDIELRGLSEPLPDFNLRLYDGDDALLAEGSHSSSVRADGRFYPLVAFSLVDGGLYRIVLEGGGDGARFRVKVRESQPIAPSESNDPLALSADSGSLVQSLVDILGDLPPSLGLALGNRAPDFAIDILDGQSLRLAELRGKVVLLNFWGTWCGPCRREMPEFQKAYDEWRAQGFEILAIAYNDSEAAMRNFRDEYGLSFSLALDVSGDINSSYAIQTRPSSFLLDAEGIILARHFGLMTEMQLSDMLMQAFDRR